MSNHTINSQEYWNDRFANDWKEYSGNEQTKYFASILNEMLPEWLIYEANENRYMICDMGCAEGDALPIYKHVFMKSDIIGEDFSEEAIEIARKNYAEFDFKVSDILKPEGEPQYPIVICSNVVEHFKDTYEVISKICERASKYAVILIPYREEEGAISEHERVFHTKDIPMQVEGCNLIYTKSIACESVYYPYEQLMLIYAKEDKFSRLSDVVENINSDREQKKEAEKNAEILEYTRQIEEIKAQYEADTQKKYHFESAIKEKDNFLAASEKELLSHKSKIAEYEQKVTEYEQKVTELGAKIEAEAKQRIWTEKELEKNSHEMALVQKNYLMAQAVLEQKNEYMLQVQGMCNHFATGKLMQMNHFLFRIKGQLIKGTKQDRKEFWAWLGGRIRKTNRTIGAGAIYNPWMVVNEKLKEAIACRPMPVEQFHQSTDTVKEKVCGGTMTLNLPEETRRILQKDYTKYDVIILSVIDYNFRHQRPQHFATRFAANGHRVFYVNANFIRPDSISAQQENLYVVDFACAEHNAIYTMDGKDTLDWMQDKFDNLIFTQAIRDAVVIVDYPNWVYGAEFIREKYGFKIVTDYMDDYTGFLGTAEDFLKNNCIQLLKTSDTVVASSQFLYDVASKHTDTEKIAIVRNGTEVEHFYQAVGMENAQKERKVIGYYGAVAHWFAWEKVCFLAKKFPECDIVIVGDVTEHRDKLEKHQNIKLLGEKPYKELPQYLADFDVCLIPFDTSTDLIKATNPVKFYEYLSAGKKIVATEIPELEPFRDEYVYMSNDEEQFAEYVKLCLDGNDSLQGSEECIAFAKENDWQKRYECFGDACVAHIPMISVIVLTYNNLYFNKQCIDSILNKTAYANYELIIVDNQSTDGTVEFLKQLEWRNLPNVKVILNDENHGFAGGNNIGINASKGEYVLLLNNDTVVTRGWLTAMAKHLENNPKYGMCNPVTNSIGNESKICARYYNIQEMHEFAYASTAANMQKEYTDADRMPLFSTLIRKAVIDKVGMLDDSYKIGMFEDDDYTESVKAANYDIVIADDAFVHHINNGSFKKLDDEEYKKIFNANKAIFEKKWNQKWTMPKYREGVTADCNVGTTI